MSATDATFAALVTGLAASLRELSRSLPAGELDGLIGPLSIFYDPRAELAVQLSGRWYSSRFGTGRVVRSDPSGVDGWRAVAVYQHGIAVGRDLVSDAEESA